MQAFFCLHCLLCLCYAFNCMRNCAQCLFLNPKRECKMKLIEQTKNEGFEIRISAQMEKELSDEFLNLFEVLIEVEKDGKTKQQRISEILTDDVTRIIEDRGLDENRFFDKIIEKLMEE